MTVSLFLFGSPTVEYGGKSVALPFERRNQLLVFLALKRSWVGRAELAAMFWPEQESKLAYANLRKILHRLQSLRWASSIESQGAALRFEAETDVFAFESALREQRIAEALPMRRGELLAGFDDDQSEAWSSWLNFERDRLRVAWREAALNRLGVDIDTAEGIDLSKRLLDADPLDEAAVRAHMSWLARSGQSARARQVYHEFVRRLADDLGLAPGAELRALHDSLGTAVLAPIAAKPAPVKLDPDFIGRTVELRRIASLLAQDDCRLLCVIGPGGVGKTRLAQRAIHEFAPRFSDGATFVALEDISSATELGGRLARELGVSLAGSDEPLDQVIKFLRERQVLLVLDNFEHLVADASILDRLIQACARLKIIVTSRVRPALAIEWLLPLEGLPCPEIEDQDRFEAFDAVRLFVQAAQRVEPALVPAVEAASIVDICQQVEGLPLALELAAAWTRVLSCEAIAVELRQGTQLLHAVDPAHPARHTSLEVVFDHSWQLLTATERDALSRLSVFRGGFSAETARAIAAAPLPVLGALADKSLLRKDDKRIFMHPLVQQLAAGRLTDGARAATESTHALYFLRWMAQLAGAARNGDREVLQQLDVEFENVRVAWHWAAANGQIDVLMGSTQTLFSFCVHRGRFAEGLALLRAGIESHSSHLNPRFEPLLSSFEAHLEYQLTRYNDAEATATRALAASRSTRDHDTRLQCVKTLGACCLMLGRYKEARRHYRQALQQTSASTQPNNAAAMLDNLSLVEMAMGHYDEALRMSMQSLVQHRRLADVGGEALCLNNIGSLQLDLGEHESAALHLNEGLALCDRHGLINTSGFILANLADLALKTNNLALARARAQRGLEVAVLTGNRSNEAFLKLQLARIALKRGDLIAARADLKASMELAIAIGRPTLLLDGVSFFSEILNSQGESDCARRLLVFAAEHPSTSIQERDGIRKRLAHWKATTEAGAAAAGPMLELDELVSRVVVETPLAHAPLIATLRGAGKKLHADPASVVQEDSA